MERMKAITPVIATIMLFLMAVAFAGFAWVYIMGYFSGVTANQIELVDSFCVGTDQAKIIIRNIGTKALNTGVIRVINKRTGDDITSDIRWGETVSIPGKVLELKFDEGSGPVARDTTIFGNDGTLVGPPQWVDGRIGGALAFVGGDYIDSGDVDMFEFTTDFSVSAWVNISDLPLGFGYTIASKGGGSPYGWILFLDGQEEPIFRSNTTFAIGSVLSQDEWHNIVGVYNLTHLLIYVDGVEAGSTVIDESTKNTGAIFSIGSNQGTSSYFNGTIDDVMIFNRALDPEEIADLANSVVVVLPVAGKTTMTHTCSGRCDYGLVMGGLRTPVTVVC